MILEAKDQIVIIEVKWGQVQDPVGQWAVQLRAAHHHYFTKGGKRGRIDFLAVGGLPYPKETAADLRTRLEGRQPEGVNMHVHMLYWEDLYEEVLVVLEDASLPSEQRRVLQDIRSALEDRGLRRLLDMESLPRSQRFAGTSSDLLEAWGGLLPFQSIETLGPLSPPLIHPDQLSNWRIV